jgi:hypothetical protein
VSSGVLGRAVYRHHLRPIRAADVDLDMLAVMGSRERLWSIYGASWGWPPAWMTKEHDEEDLQRHSDETEAHQSFNYAIFDEKRHLIDILVKQRQAELLDCAAGDRLARELPGRVCLLVAPPDRWPTPSAVASAWGHPLAAGAGPVPLQADRTPQTEERLFRADHAVSVESRIISPSIASWGCASSALSRSRRGLSARLGHRLGPPACPGAAGTPERSVR